MSLENDANGAAAEDEQRSPVTLAGMPVARFIALQEHFDGLVRELQLVAVGQGQGLATSARLADLALYVQLDIADERRILHEQVVVALEQDLPIVDVHIDLRSTGITGAWQMVEVFEAIDSASRDGFLLTGPADPDLVALLRWIATEVEAQVRDGRPPVRFAP